MSFLSFQWCLEKWDIQLKTTIYELLGHVVWVPRNMLMAFVFPYLTVDVFKWIDAYGVLFSPKATYDVLLCTLINQWIVACFRSSWPAHLARWKRRTPCWQNAFTFSVLSVWKLDTRLGRESVQSVTLPLELMTIIESTYPRIPGPANCN